MGRIPLLQNSRHRLEDDLGDTRFWWYVTPALYLVRYALVPLLQKQTVGDVLDVGCGRMPYRQFLDNVIEEYHGYDCERRSDETAFIGDAHHLEKIPDNSYDTVISFSVLEHLPKPWIAVEEMARVCRPGGKVIIEVPHLSRYHELPHDYYRFTEMGLREIGEQAGLEAVTLERHGGLSCLIGHQISTVIMSLAWCVPFLRWLIFWFNYWFCVRASVALDRFARTEKLMPMSVVGVFCKPEL